MGGNTDVPDGRWPRPRRKRRVLHGKPHTVHARVAPLPSSAHGFACVVCYLDTEIPITHSSLTRTRSKKVETWFQYVNRATQSRVRWYDTINWHR
jgi:hypothetical protein